MSATTAIGNKPIQSTYLPAGVQAGGKAAGALTAGASGNGVARLPVVEPVSQLADTVSLSKQGLETRAAELGADTVKLAQTFIDNFAKKLFGGGAAGSEVTFDSFSVNTQASVEAGASATSGADGSTTSAYLKLSESASFVGKGQITTTDGQTFEFEIEINYEASVEASGSQTSSRPANIASPDLLALTGRALPAIEFPGSLADLFKLLGRELQVSVPKNPNRPEDGDQGNLTLRLLRLVNSAALLAPRALPDDPKASAVDRSKALAHSYGDKPASSEIAAA
jgi:hypothetical protein